MPRTDGHASAHRPIFCPATTEMEMESSFIMARRAWLARQAAEQQPSESDGRRLGGHLQ